MNPLQKFIAMVLAGGLVNGYVGAGLVPARCYRGTRFDRWTFHCGPAQGRPLQFASQALAPSANEFPVVNSFTEPASLRNLHLIARRPEGAHEILTTARYSFKDVRKNQAILRGVGLGHSYMEIYKTGFFKSADCVDKYASLMARYLGLDETDRRSWGRPYYNLMAYAYQRTETVMDFDRALFDPLLNALDGSDARVKLSPKESWTWAGLRIGLSDKEMDATTKTPGTKVRVFNIQRKFDRDQAIHDALLPLRKKIRARIGLVIHFDVRMAAVLLHVFRPPALPSPGRRAA